MENTEKYRGATSELDSEAIQKLYYEYQMTNQEIADMTWSTKANVNKVLIHGIKHYTSWFMEMLSEDDDKIFRKMLMYHKFSYWNEKQQRRYLIKNSRDGKICLIYFDEKCVKCMFDEFVPEDLKTLSIVEKMNIYNEMDYEVLKCSERDSILKKECILLNGDSKQLFKKAAHKRNMKGKEYAQFLGFESCLTEKDSIRDSRIIKFFEEHMVDGVVQLSSSPENQWIRNYAHRYGMHLDEFLDFYGYKKSRRADEYVSENKNIKYKKELSKYIIEPPNIVYFSSQDKIYQTIYNVAKLNEMSIDEYILSLGYVRSKKSNTIKELTEEIDEIIDLEEQEIRKKEISENKIERNHKLIDKLKRAYDYECQLCSNEQRMPIEKQDGTKYVEVHHIKNLSEEYDEEGTLDRLNNLIVVCPNHHKMLHYHKGGYRKIKIVNEVLVFVNDSEEVIPIITNKHLKSDE